MAVRTLIDWHRSGEDIDRRMPELSPFLGHTDPASTCRTYSSFGLPGAARYGGPIKRCGSASSGVPHAFHGACSRVARVRRARVVRRADAVWLCPSGSGANPCVGLSGDEAGPLAPRQVAARNGACALLPGGK
jgi:hypothetical protein